MTARVCCSLISALLCLSVFWNTRDAEGAARVSTKKPGMCPSKNLKIGVCAEFCSCDSNCPNNQKCCSNGCGHQCMPPHTEKPGVCPRTTPRMKGVCAERCSHDGDCPNDEKCCSNGCGHQCTALPKEKPGMCPMTLAGLRGIVCEELCVSDFDCREMRRLQLYLWRTSMYTCILRQKSCPTTC
ncbi:whey acidic protein-like isoform X2 [Cyprinus carpio]|uniref:Whey acidic protein-like isoform X2 n=1 Tax=Cyprinus carpio TaxID=7962 RepID=A0A9Q9VYJ6_CYPCA|nr:whey acidic protein-like isoform X2 [Cyprinus carpio]